MFLFIFLIIIKNNKFKGAAMCVIAKKENLYINEFVNYYRQLGIKKIYLYDNNDLFGENFSNVLKKEIKHNFVEIINVRGKSRYQRQSYEDCYQKHLDQYSWFLFVDIDEFLFIKNNVSLSNFLTDKKFKKCDSIVINYREFGDSDLLHYDDRPVTKRFNSSRYCLSMKSFLKGGIKNARMDVHRPLNIKYYCNSKGEIIVPASYFTYNLSIENAEIRHYITKTIDEFIMRIKKGWPLSKVGEADYYKKINDRTKYFFSINKITEYKLNKIFPFIEDNNLKKFLLMKLNNTKNGTFKI